MLLSLRSTRLFIFLTMALAVLACQHDSSEDTLLPSNPNNGGENTCDPNVVYFEQQILPILASSCAQPDCHDATDPESNVNLSNYASIMQEVTPGNPNTSDLWEVITDDDAEDRMPPVGENPLSDQQINLITQWINQGALNNSCSNSCNPSAFTFNTTIHPTLTNYCQGCHSGTNPDAGLTLINYEQIQTIAADGRLMHAINGTGGITQMPFQSNPLSDCQKQQIQSWVNAGSPNN